MAHAAGVGAHGLWSISCTLARGLESRADYTQMMDYADTPQQGDLDGRGNPSLRALVDFIVCFLRVCIDQVTFMSGLFELEALSARFVRYVDRSDLKPEAAQLLNEALYRRSFQRGDARRITGLPERSASPLLNEVIAAGLLTSETSKEPASLGFPSNALDTLIPRLFLEA